MLLASFPAGPWQTNCYVVAPEQGADVVVIDPGVQAAEKVAAWADAEGVGVVGVLLTHGHLDHVASAADLADRFGCPAWIHADDRELLSDAGPIVPATLDLGRELGVHLREPAALTLLTGGEDVNVGGLSFHVHHAPGHRPGCVMYALADAEGTMLFSGDVLFAGSIGRTDLPGGDAQVMATTLREVVLALPDDATVFPGHGPQTTIGAERGSNPYLQPSFLR